MSTLQNVLSELLTADAEAKKTVEISAKEASDVLQQAQDEFEQKSKTQLEAARKQADELMQSALHNAEAESASIEKSAAAQRETLREEMTRAIPQLVDTLADKIISSYAEKEKH